MKWVAFILLLLLVWLQYSLWLNEGGVPELLELEAEVEAMSRQVEELRERNQALDAEVQDLKKGLEAIEERARNDMGMIKQGEVYYQVIETPEQKREESP